MSDSDSDYGCGEDCDRPLVIDCGSYKITSGFGCDDAPISVLSANIGHLKDTTLNPNKDKEIYFGDYAAIPRFDYKIETDKLEIQQTTEYFPPIDDILIDGYIRNNFKKKLPNDITNLINNHIPRGMIINWNELGILWQHMFSKELRVMPDEHRILLSEPPLNSKCNRNRTAEIMFEKFNCPALHLRNTASLSLIASGRTVGIVVDSGHYKTDIVPIYNGVALRNNTLRLQLGGADISNYLQTLLKDINNISLSLDVVTDIKETLAYVDTSAYDLDIPNNNEMKSKSYELPDGKCINIDKKLLKKSTQILFEPTLINKRGVGTNSIAKSINESITRCDIDMRSDLYHNIVLSGGNTLFNNIDIKLVNEMQKVTGFGVCRKIHVVAPPERKYSAWIGGSIAVSVTNMVSWVEYGEYEEYGDKIIHRKCF